MLPNTLPLPNPLLGETLISLADAATRIPSFRAGRATNASTIFRWAKDGVRGPDGRRLKLETVRIVSRWVTSVEALTRFLEAQNPPPADVAQAEEVQRVASPARQRRAAARAMAELERRGA